MNTKNITPENNEETEVVTETKATEAVDAPAAETAVATETQTQTRPAREGNDGERPQRSEGYGNRGRGGPHNRRRRKVCLFCTDKNETIDYKAAFKLKKFVTERGKILPRRVSGACALHQRELTSAIKTARHMALMAYTSD